MGVIKVLAEEVANRIAAGEVIERPASVVKELVENALDAGADNIVISVENGGKTLLSVSDNGCGMSEDDAMLAFERHATSKIRTVDDIFHINTMGFRGEALPSIASVGHLTMITRRKENPAAVKIEFNGGRLHKVEPAAANPGTTVTLRNLFYNVPARRKFLKTEPVETKHILNYIHYQAIMFPSVHFQLFIDGKQRLNYPVVLTRRQRMLAIFGSDFEKQDMIPVSVNLETILLEGYIKGLEETKTQLVDYRFVFINGRYVRDRIILHALKAAYEPFAKKLNILRENTLPPHILFLQVDPEIVDFNVHPAKTEIRFRDSQAVHSLIKTAVTNVLLSHEDKIFHDVKTAFADASHPRQIPVSAQRIFRDREPKIFEERKGMGWEKLYQPDAFRESVPVSPTPAPKAAVQDSILLRNEEDVVNPWQLHQSYILVQVEDGFVVIDQHAAHERFLYERMMRCFAGAPAQRQKLLFPIVIEIPPIVGDQVKQLLTDNMDAINRTGFSLKSFSGDTIVIDEIPAELEDWNDGEIFIEILKHLENEFDDSGDFHDSFAKSLSCKAAIKAGKKLGRKEMLSLINDLFACRVPYFCPHGRPVIVKISLTEIEKRLKRIES